MVQLSFTAKTREVLEQERYAHPHPKVQRKMEAVYLKSLALPHHLIKRICNISEPALLRYLRAFERGGVAGRKQLGYKGRPNGLAPHRASLEEQFRRQPPPTCAHAQQLLEAQTGVRRSLTQVRAFLHRATLRYRKTGFVPGQADTPEKPAAPAALLKKPPPQTGGSASGPAGGVVPSRRALRLRSVPGLLVVFGARVPALPGGPAAVPCARRRGRGQPPGSSRHQRNLHHRAERVFTVGSTGGVLCSAHGAAAPLAGPCPLPAVRLGPGARPGIGHRVGVSARLLAEPEPDRTRLALGQEALPECQVSPGLWVDESHHSADHGLGP